MEAAAPMPGEPAGAEAAHYSSAREQYDVAPFYADGPYVRWLEDECVDALRLQCRGGGQRSAMRLAYVGGGSGSFAARLKQRFAAEGSVCELTVVEPSRAMLAGAEANQEIDCVVNADARAWADSGAAGQYDRMLMKEVYHHCGGTSTDRERTLRALRERLAPGGRLLVVSRPRDDVDFPLWPEGDASWAESASDISSTVAELRAAGFVDVDVRRRAYVCELELGAWCAFVRNRVWSNFARFSDAELDAGCAQIRATHAASAARGGAADGVLRFEDRVCFIAADTPPQMSG